MQQPWLEHYPQGVPDQVRTDSFPSLCAWLAECFRTHRERPAFVFMGRRISFGDIDAHAAAFAAWMQSRGLQRGDRVAVMLTNLPQYAVVVAGAWRAGLVVVNVSPQFSARELELQLKDAGAKAIVVLEHFAAVLQQVLPALPALQVVLAATGDLLGIVRGALANLHQRRRRAAVPRFSIDGALRFNEVLARGRGLAWTPVETGPEDIALLQYTGGTTGAARAAVLLHRNLLALVQQNAAWQGPALVGLPAGEQLQTACLLPFDQAAGFSAGLLLGLHHGACSLLLADAGDAGELLAQLAPYRLHSLPAAEPLYRALLQHPGFHRVDWSALRLSVASGMAVRPETARRWQQSTGCPISEAYGLSEAGSSVSCHPVGGTGFYGGAGLPLPGTELRLLGDDGAAVAPGSTGEIAIRGPQVMAGYWQRPEETARVMTADGFLRTGDIGVLDERGALRVVDRKTDMIIAGGYKVYPNEIEDVVTQMPGVLEAAAIGVEDEEGGERVKLVVVRSDTTLTAADVRAFCAANLAGYKRPEIVEFRAELPKTAVGKILRRALREAG